MVIDIITYYYLLIILITNKILGLRDIIIIKNKGIIIRITNKE